MTRLRRAVLALGLSGTIAALAVARPGLAGGGADSPEGRLKARIIDLQVEVAVLEVECAARRENLLETLRTVGRLELGDRKSVFREIQEELDQARMMANAVKMSQEVLDGAQGRLSGPAGEAGVGKKTPDRSAEDEWKERLASSRVQAEGMKADFQRKVRSLHQKRRELDDAEAEYRATK
jgi:hypothetical protein